MTQPTRIHKDKLPKRIHYIPEWADKHGLKQRDLVESLNADKSIVSRWYKGNLPSERYLFALAEMFDIEVGELFRHPDDDWMSRLLRGRSLEEKARIKATIEAAFPKVA